MRSIWVRAGLGALAVFALGMMLYTAVRTTKAKAKAALLELKAELDSGAVVAALDHLDRAIPFVLDGRTVGQLRRLTFEPGQGSTSPALNALVALDREHLDAAMLSSCDLVPVNTDRFEVSQGFRCATPADRGLRQLGEVRFEPVGVVRPVRADKAALAQLRQHGTITIDSSPGGALHANISGDSGELVNIQADSNGAYIHVNDGKGKIVKVRADKTGLVVKVGLEREPVGSRGSSEGRTRQSAPLLFVTARGKPGTMLFMAMPRGYRRLTPWVLLALVPAIGLVWFVIDRRSKVIETVLRDWASRQVAAATDSTYQLSVSGVDLSVLSGRIVIDSLRLVTDTSRNDFRAVPLPVLTATATGCGVRGVNVWGLLLGRGVNARLFRCEGIHAAVLEVVRRRVPVKPAAETPKAGVPLVSDSIHLPAILPRIVVHATELPNISLDYTRRATDSSEMHLTLERLGLVLRETRIDPAVPPKARRPVFSDEALLSATSLEMGSEQQSVLLGRVRANLTDSTLAIDSVVIGPPMSDADWIKLQKQRRDLIRMHVDSARFRGVDYRRLGSIEGGVVAKRVELFDFRVHVTTYKDLPAGPKKRRRSPQQFVAALERPLAIDTLIVTGGRIAYTEQPAGKPAGGTMTWENVQAHITDVKSGAPVGIAPPPMLIKASALLLGKGKLETTIEIPLAAPQFDMKYSGTLGPMDLTAISAFSEPVLSAKITGGSLQSARFSVVVRNGRSVGQITPLYRDFKIQLTDKKANFVKKAGMAIVSLFANTFKVRGSNPDKPGETPVVGRINRPYSATASLPQFFWYALREGLGKVFVK